MRSSRTLYALAFSIAAIGAALSPPASALPKSGSSGGHSAPTSEPTPWYQTSQSDVHCGSNDPVVAVFLGNPKFYAPPGSQESYSSSGFTCKSVAIDHGLLPPPSVAPGWHMSSMTGSVAWNAPTSERCGWQEPKIQAFSRPGPDGSRARQDWVHEHAETGKPLNPDNRRLLDWGAEGLADF